MKYATDPVWARYLPVTLTYSRVDAEKFVASQVLLNRETHPAWAISLDGSMIGGINLRFEFEQRIAQVGYGIARNQWGKGIVSEAAHAVFDAAFSTHSELHRIRAFADARNKGSRRVMEKLGMVPEGILRQNRIVRGEFVDDATYGILRNEWKVGAGRSVPDK